MVNALQHASQSTQGLIKFCGELKDGKHPKQLSVITPQAKNFIESTEHTAELIELNIKMLDRELERGSYERVLCDDGKIDVVIKNTIRGCIQYLEYCSITIKEAECHTNRINSLNNISTLLATRLGSDIAMLLSSMIEFVDMFLKENKLMSSDEIKLPKYNVKGRGPDSLITSLVMMDYCSN